MTEKIETAFQGIQNRVAEAQKKSAFRQNVTLIAVSKTQSLEAIRTLYRLGQRDFGENYAQEMQLKAETLAQEGFREIRWHFIGHLQTNKLKMILPHAYAIHSIDSLRLAEEISKKIIRNLPVFLEVNVNEEKSKSGFLTTEIETISQKVQALPLLDLRGLMAIPSSELNEDALMKTFTSLKEKTMLLKLPEASMGMSADFEIAIRAGATHIRVGSALFGARKPK